MGQYSGAASNIGFQLGMASYVFTTKDPNNGKAEIGSASEWAAKLVPIVTVNIDPNSVNNEQDVINLRDQVAGTLASKNPILHDIYQFSLHVGLATGQSFAPASSWAAAVPLCVRALQQALQDFRQPTLRALASTHYDKVLTDVTGAISSQHYDSQFTDRIVIPFNTQVTPMIFQEQSLP